MADDRLISPDPAIRRWQLAEELSEVIKELSKGERFGFDTPSPKDGTTPRARLLDEIDDARKLLSLVEADILDGRYPL